MSYRDECEKLYLENIELKKELAEMDRPQTEVEFLLIKIEELESRLKEAEYIINRYLKISKEHENTLEVIEEYVKKYNPIEK